MIDDEIEVNRLVGELQAILPIEAYPSKSLYLKLKYENKLKIDKRKILKINEVLYLGDAGGICCNISSRNSSEAIIVSITQLKFNRSLSFASKISEYTSRRVKEISKV